MYTFFRPNYGQSAWNSVKVQPISTDRTPNHAERPPKCRTAEIACTISELHVLSPKLAGKRCIWENVKEPFGDSVGKTWCVSELARIFMCYSPRLWILADVFSRAPLGTSPCISNLCAKRIIISDLKTHVTVSLVSVLY